MGSNVVRDTIHKQDTTEIDFTKFVIPINQSIEPWCPPEELSNANGTCILCSLGMLISAQVNLLLHNLKLPIEKDSLPIRSIFAEDANEGHGTEEYIQSILQRLTIVKRPYIRVVELTPNCLKQLLLDYGPFVVSFERKEYSAGHAILVLGFLDLGNDMICIKYMDPNYACPDKDPSESVSCDADYQFVEQMDKDFYVTIYRYELRKDFTAYLERGLSVSERCYLFGCLLGKIGAHRIFGQGEEYKLPSKVNNIIKSYL